MTNDPYQPYDPRPYPPPAGYPPPEPGQHQPGQHQPGRYPPEQYPPAPSPTPQQYPPDAYPPTEPYPTQQYPPSQNQQYPPSQPPPYPADPYGGGQYPAGRYPVEYAGGAPPGWSPAGPPPPPRRRRTGLIIGLVAGGLALVLCLAGIAVVALRVVDQAGEPGSDDPFAGSPAAGFAAGEAGIELPEATATGDFTAAQVADALTRVREALIASRLDLAMLVQRDPEPFLALMSEDNQPILREDFETTNFRYFASQFADGAALADPTPRVKGEITFEATRDEGNFRVIEVVTRFAWAYAFEVPGGDPDLDGIVVVRDELVWQVAHEEDVAGTSLGLWLWDGEAYAWGIDCAAFARGLLSPQTGPGPAGDPDDQTDIFDPSSPLDIPDSC